MAGTVTETPVLHKPVKRLKWAWVSSAGGAADDASADYYSGVISRVVFIPDSGGTQPTDLYDVVINDDDGVDVLDGGGANRSNASTQQITAGLGAVCESKLTLAVTNAGNAKGGTVIVYVV